MLREFVLCLTLLALSMPVIGQGGPGGPPPQGPGGGMSAGQDDKGKEEKDEAGNDAKDTPPAPVKPKTDSWVKTDVSGPSPRETAFKRVLHACRNEQGFFCNGFKKNDEAAVRCVLKHQEDATKDCSRVLDSAKEFLTAKPRLHAKKPGSDSGSP